MSSEPPTKLAKMNDVKEQTNQNIVKPVTKTTQKYNYEFNSLSDNGMKLFFKQLSPKAITPLRATRNAAGFDLFSVENRKIASYGRECIPTGIAIALPTGSYGRIAPKSGLAFKHGLDVGAGVIDVDYRGEVGVILFNFSDKEYEVKEGDKIAQLIIERIYMPSVEKVDDLSETDRGSGGFGSTGR